MLTYGCASSCAHIRVKIVLVTMSVGSCLKK